ncbi:MULTISPECIES: Fur family transcriptional regulator [unclassified Streptomyces]|jgi:Fur family transcriptional regulator, ferric uptake regulator|uniref:Fur family transcriptional regulator n=1 Tax=unclassified Streptomyces TaxID=2593676 RepID=UPI000A1E55D8|nr:transcriptional repressor [Streptomyces sp. 13-12-16]OSP43490.1 transcriptional repressor [Streptomyces sp. 13-12-16]
MYGTARSEWRTTPRRAAVLGALHACDGFVSAQTLHAALVRDGVAVGLTTVYRTLRLLEAAGHVDVVRDSDGERLYRPRPDDGHRHYLVCRECGLSLAVDSDEVEQWVVRIARDIGFHSVDHTVELTGVCDGCRPGPVDR